MIRLLRKRQVRKRRDGRSPDGPSADVGAADNNNSGSDVSLATPKEPEPRVSATEAEARVMKMADGSFRPAFNAQLAVDVQTQLIAAVAVTNSGSDMVAR